MMDRASYNALGFTTTVTRRITFGYHSPTSSCSSCSSSSSSPNKIYVSSSSEVDTTMAEVEEEEDWNELGGCTVGDTKGATLLLEKVSISRGSNVIIDEVGWRVERGERWGIVGPNGAGKSTLLGAITGSIDMDPPSSVALVSPKTRVGYLKQTAVGNSARTVFDEASSGMIDIMRSKRAMDRLYEKVGNGDTSEKTLSALDIMTEKYQNAGGYTLESTVENVLRGLGFRDRDSKRLCSEFSGGWQMRIGLAKLLLSAPTLLLLDEPSNHLDSSARDWLGNYLSRYDGTIILVSHDVNLLTACTNNIAEVVGNSGKLINYVSVTYESYLEQKEFRAKSALSEYERNMAEAAKLQAYVDRFGASATKASSAQSRVKQLEKMKKEGKLTPPPMEVSQAERFKPTLSLPDPPKGMGDVLLGLSNCDVGYKDKPILVSNVNLDITRGMKLILRGKNGAGKSTLMKALFTQEENNNSVIIESGERIENDNLHTGVFTQDLAQQLPLHRRALDIVLDYARVKDFSISDQRGRSVLGQLGMSGDKPLRLIKDLSGGEKARVALGMFALRPNNLLLLDEPSNHLDTECVEALSEALGTWGVNRDDDKSHGAVVVVSHDRAFCETVGFTHVGTVSNGRLVVEERDLRDSDWEVYGLQADGTVDNAISTPTTNTVKKVLTPKEKAAQAKRRKDILNAPKRIQRLEQMVEKAEMKCADINEQMLQANNDVSKLVELNKQKEKEESSVEKMMEEWEGLEELLATVEGD